MGCTLHFVGRVFVLAYGEYDDVFVADRDFAVESDAFILPSEEYKGCEHGREIIGVIHLDVNPSGEHRQ
ncbi:hypothetical protein Q5P01_002968 [Channa striata]|uniref:Uncharacterized protein n=1 Tax=Channa striata TaxID=64152 RepID=A0AA88TEG0_CHASR|nr:hypothetical protein Q5P01_002968 [Channa striata]